MNNSEGRWSQDTPNSTNKEDSRSTGLTMAQHKMDRPPIVYSITLEVAMMMMMICTVN